MFDAKKLLDLLVQGGATPQQAQNLGGIVNQVGSVVSSVLGQATAGAKQAAGEVNAATGISGKANDLIGQFTGGQSAADLVNKAKDMAGKNPLGAGAVVGGLAAVLLGTGAGRAVVGSAARMGGLALIGGLAYKALQNYQAGKPILDLQSAASDMASGSVPQITGGDDNARALRLVRAMIAAASADGIIDDAERAAILGNLKAAGLDDEASAFIDNEFANPADLASLNDSVETPTQAAEVYTAARLAIDPDTPEEKAFLAALASQLGLEANLVAHIEAAAASAKAGA
ncbi:MAG: tellurite resistance TerB family protein [Proteobacteria bacterium]|nr:tellurite resistance TerB family protein [Pseudomonadota bacterium]